MTVWHSKVLQISEYDSISVYNVTAGNWEQFEI